MQANVIEKIRQEINIVEIIAEYLNLTKKGNNFIAICPFHQDSHPSLTISQIKQIFKCFACGIGGDGITFISKYEKISFQQAIKKLANKLGYQFEIKEKAVTYSEKEIQMINVLKDANDFFMNAIMTPEGKEAYEYALKRNLTKNLIEKFKIGYSFDNNKLHLFLKSKNHDEIDIINSSLINNNQKPFFQNRLTFAIENINGDIVGFSGREINQKTTIKYINSSESLIFDKSTILYNFSNAKQAIKNSGEIVIVEGFMDVIALYKINIHNVVALMGTNLSNKHLEIIKNYHVILMLDFDKAGIKATLKFIEILLKNKIYLEIIVNQFNLDPDEIFNKHGGEELQKVFNKRISAIEFVYQNFLPKKSNLKVKQIENFIKNFKNFLLLSNELEQEFYVNQMVKDFNLSKLTIKKILSLPKTNNNLIIDKKFLIYPKNYEKIVIRSMIKNPQFIPLFIKNNLSFEEEILNQIIIYLKNYQNNTVLIPLKIKQKCQEILNESDEIAHSFVEFEEYIDRIKWTNKQRTHLKITESIKNISDPNIAIQLLKEQIKLKRGK